MVSWLKASFKESLQVYGDPVCFIDTEQMQSYSLILIYRQTF